jgi:tetraacyldisaccharide-1-P 4'-kinase
MHERKTSSENKMQQMSRQQAQIMQTHANINTNLSKLEACIAKNNAEIKQLTAKTDGVMTTKQDIFKIKAAVNENASVLQALYQDLRRDRKA